MDGTHLDYGFLLLNLIVLCGWWDDLCGVCMVKKKDQTLSENDSGATNWICSFRGATTSDGAS